MIHFRLAIVVALLTLAFPVPGGAGPGPGFGCEGSFCAAASPEGSGARVDWPGGHIDVGTRSGKFLPGGASVRDFTQHWLSVSLRNPSTGLEYFNCFRELPADAFTLNPDDSATLVYSEGSCTANVTWSPVLTRGPYVYWGIGGSVDPDTGTGGANVSLYRAREATASGTVGGAAIDQAHYAETHDVVGACAANAGCWF